MKIDNRIIQYEINKQLPKPAQNEMEGIKGAQNQEVSKVQEKDQARQDTIVNLSTASKDAQMARKIVASEPDMRQDKVSELKQKIESGNYSVDHKAVADKMVNSFLDEIF
jgi:negative regulator of flagellin synthesis FlgM